MKWFKKLLKKMKQLSVFKKRTRNNNIRHERMEHWFSRLFAKSKLYANKNGPILGLRIDQDIIPKTEITSPQAQDNIRSIIGNEVSLELGESSGECSKKNKNEKSEKKKTMFSCYLERRCKNKNCCNVMSRSLSIVTDKGIKTIKYFYTNSHLITLDDNSNCSDNERDENENADNFTNQNLDELIFSDDDLVVVGGELLKCKDYDTFMYKTQPMDDEVLTNLELLINSPEYNLEKCKFFNFNYRLKHKNYGSGCRLKLKLFEAPDDNKMDKDTIAIKEFYRLSALNDILIHYNDISVEEADQAEEILSLSGLLNIFKWQMLKGSEIREQTEKEEKNVFPRIRAFFSSKSLKQTFLYFCALFIIL